MNVAVIPCLAGSVLDHVLVEHQVVGHARRSQTACRFPLGRLLPPTVMGFDRDFPMTLHRQYHLGAQILHTVDGRNWNSFFRRGLWPRFGASCLPDSYLPSNRSRGRSLEVGHLFPDLGVGLNLSASGELASDFELSGNSAGIFAAASSNVAKILCHRRQIEWLVALDHCGADLGLVAIGLDQGLARFYRILLGGRHANRNSRNGSDGEYTTEDRGVPPLQLAENRAARFWLNTIPQCDSSGLKPQPTREIHDPA